MENESNVKKIAFSIIGILVIGAALFALWYRSQSAESQAGAYIEVPKEAATVVETPKDDPYGKLVIPPSK